MASQATPNTPRPSAKNTPMRYVLQASVRVAVAEGPARARAAPTSTAAPDRPCTRPGSASRSGAAGSGVGV